LGGNFTTLFISTLARKGGSGKKEKAVGSTKVARRGTGLSIQLSPRLKRVLRGKAETKKKKTPSAR